jgi:hypothetical protein
MLLISIQIGLTATYCLDKTGSHHRPDGRGHRHGRPAFAPTLLTALLPSSWQDTIGPYLPMNAGDAIYIARPEAHMLQPWAGFGVFCLYAAAALAAGFILIGRRDA